MFDKDEIAIIVNPNHSEQDLPLDARRIRRALKHIKASNPLISSLEHARQYVIDAYGGSLEISIIEWYQNRYELNLNKRN